MDSLFAYYNDKFKKIEGNIFELFDKFYSMDLGPINSWLESQFKNKVLKDNNISTVFRQEGNKFYAKKDLMKSLEYYTKSLCCATPYSKEYGLALGNRSAVSFELKEFEYCLKDIELCLKTNYPTDLKPKIFIRKAECCFELGDKEALEECISGILTLFENEAIIDTDKFITRLNILQKLPIKHHKFSCYRDNINDLPTFEDGENESFAYASSKIKMSYTKPKGRHVVASRNINRGDIIFIEKAFIFAPVFKERKEFYLFKCYNCLKDVLSSIPCKTCTLCIYCDENCRKRSWEEGHKWECDGMQANIWYDLGIAFPAFKAMLKGISCRFRAIKGSYEEDLKKFGDKSDNYPYFSRMISNIYKSKNVAPYIVMAAIVVSYLRKYTDFFTWLQRQPVGGGGRRETTALARHVGGALAKHIAQLASNSSVVEHWTSSSADLLFPDMLVTVACGMFPSVSIMNHSCRPNVTNFFICDTIIVKALEDIAENEEIYNCYGIDYRAINKEQRQNACITLYHFECTCVICSDPMKELETLDSYLCPKCKGLIPEVSNNVISFCLQCGEKFSLRPFRKINTIAQEYLENESASQLELLIKCLKIREKLLYKHHKDFEEVYYRLYNYYVEKGDAENMFKYFHLWLENEKARKGNNSRGIGTKLYEAALAILHCLQRGTPKNCNNLKDFLQNVEHMIREAKSILNLYYPAYITDRLIKKLQFISTK